MQPSPLLVNHKLQIQYDLKMAGCLEDILGLLRKFIVTFQITVFPQQHLPLKSPKADTWRACSAAWKVVPIKLFKIKWRNDNISSCWHSSSECFWDPEIITGLEITARCWSCNYHAEGGPGGNHLFQVETRGWKKSLPLMPAALLSFQIAHHQ